MYPHSIVIEQGGHRIFFGFVQFLSIFQLQFMKGKHVKGNFHENERRGNESTC